MIKDNLQLNESVKPNTAFLEELRNKLPEFFNDEGFDIEKFQNALKENDVNEFSEGYQLNFIGKDYARKQAGDASTSVIVPDNEHNQKEENKNSKNLFFTGDNLEVLRHLRNNYSNKIDVIYIDPPYNTGNDDFVYPDKFEYSNKQLKEVFGMSDEDVSKLDTLKGSKSHSAWLTFMYPRLWLAKQLLADDGVIFISIDDNEQSNLKLLLDEIFGVNNFISNIGIEISKTQGNKVGAAKKGKIVKNYEYVLAYQKTVNDFQRVPLYDEGNIWDQHYTIYYDGDKIENLFEYIYNDEIYLEFKKDNLCSRNGKLNHDAIEKGILINTKIKDFFYKENSDKIFREMPANLEVPDDVIQKLNKQNILNYENHLLISKGNNKFDQLLSFGDSIRKNDEYNSKYTRTTIRGNLWKGFYSDMMNVKSEDDVSYKNGKKPIRLIEQLIKWSGKKSGIVMDFFAGSGTTASAVMNYNKDYDADLNYILVQLPESLDERMEKGSSETRKEAKKLIKLLDENKIKRHTLDEITALRIKKAKQNLQLSSYGYKHYFVVLPEKETLDKIYDFDPERYELVSDMVDSFSSSVLGVPGNASGEDTILTTWLAEDGYDFNTDDLVEYDFAGYKAFGIKDTRLYLIDGNLHPKQTKELLNQLGTNKVKFQSIVVYGYSFNVMDMKELERGLSQLNSKVNLIKRY